MFHRHKWSDIKDGYQYCSICNKAIPVPAQECQHKWKIISSWQGEYVYFKGEVSGQILQCEKCGELKEFKIG